MRTREETGHVRRTPRRPDSLPHRQQGVPAALQASGAILALATLTCSLLGVVSAQQAIAMGLPAAVIILGDLIAASIPDPATGSRLGIQAGLRAGTLIRRVAWLAADWGSSSDPQHGVRSAGHSVPDVPLCPASDTAAPREV